MAGTWSKIEGFENYSVSDDGEIRNDKSGKIKAQRLNRYGYPITSIYKDGKAYTHRVHRLVANAFIDNPDDKPQVNHKDGNKCNNHLDNLEWSTASENLLHAYETGLEPRHASYGMRGKKNPNGGRKGLPVRVVETGEEFDSIAECSSALGINNRGVCDVLNGRQKTHAGLHFERIDKKQEE